MDGSSYYVPAVAMAVAFTVKAPTLLRAWRRRRLRIWCPAEPPISYLSGPATAPLRAVHHSLYRVTIAPRRPALLGVITGTATAEVAGHQL